MYSGYRTPKELFFSTIAGIAFAIVLMSCSIYELPSLDNLQVVSGTADTSTKGNREWPALVDNNNRRFACYFRFCSIASGPAWRQKFGTGLASTDGTLVSLEVDDQPVIDIRQFEDAKRRYWVYIITLIIIELVLVMAWFLRMRK